MNSDESLSNIGRDASLGPPRIHLLTPIQRMPVEIICEVFISSLPELVDDRRPCLRTVPLQVSHVCSWWRRIALDVPQLWTAISIEAEISTHETETEVVERHSEMIHQWFLRAGQHRALSLHYLVPTTDISRILVPQSISRAQD